MDRASQRHPVTDDLAFPGILLGRNATVVDDIVPKPAEIAHQRNLEGVFLQSARSFKARAVLVVPRRVDVDDPLSAEPLLYGAAIGELLPDLR